MKVCDEFRYIAVTRARVHVVIYQRCFAILHNVLHAKTSMPLKLIRPVPACLSGTNPRACIAWLNCFWDGTNSPACSAQARDA